MQLRKHARLLQTGGIFLNAAVVHQGVDLMCASLPNLLCCMSTCVFNK